ncbi:hypothetical protein [Crenobacter cavernae]|uniref:SLATT domain-containing protein n=1 Tax=Crenobacter cavernae TaxID=2290923 RepID=A0ABY0FE89_9NEIS|nr:hypothetical protein [Crenobacter cavernae]RXZ42669.1 hypothetical protein EBB06_12295 [Crenobacter cavernae]
MARHDLEFQLNYSILLEEMQMTLMGRIDRLFVTAQLFLGCATVFDAMPTWLTGGFVSLLAIFQVVYQFGARSMEAKIHRGTYLGIRRKLANLTDEELDRALVEAQGNDSSVSGSLTNPAWVAAARQMGLPVTDQQWRFSLLERAAAFFAGNLPRPA